MVKQAPVLSRVLAALLLVAIASPAAATVIARVDRNNVDLNESFTLEIVVDSNTSLEPELAVLEENFYVGQVSKLSNTSIVNGDIQRSMLWSVSLMPKVTGSQEIPPIPLGSELSNPVRIIVNEPGNAPPGEADVFVTAEVDLAETYVQAQILYRIKVYRAVPTRQPALKEPSFSGAEVLIELAGEEKTYEAVLNGRAYNVVERVIALYPQESGEIVISPTRFEARVLRDGRITGRKVFESEAHTIRVLPIPAPPADFPNAAWLPAREVRLNETWSRDPNELEAGEPVTRSLLLSALGQLETQVPAVEAPDVPGLNVYADKPELSRSVEPEGIRGERRDQYAIIATRGGDIELPAVEIPWWDITTGEWRVASLPARTLKVAAEPVPVVVEPEPAPAVEAAEEAAPAAAVPPGDAFWQRSTELLAVLWILTLAAWYWSSKAGARRAPRRAAEPEAPPVQRQQARLLKDARKAAVEGDTAAVRRLLLEWARLQWPEGPPRSIGSLAERVSEPLAAELLRLSGASYGPRETQWDGAALARSLKSFTVLESAEAVSMRDRLPPLMPPAA